MARIAIVGAGIGGLCAAHAVTNAGHEPIVLERAAGSTAVGAALLLWPNAIRALDTLGRGEQVRQIGHPAREMVIESQAGTFLARTDIAAIAERAGAPMVLVERPALHEVLGKWMPIRADAKVDRIDGTTLTLADGERIEADAIIGADGIGSSVRAVVAPYDHPIDSGFTVIRGIADLDVGAGNAFEAWGAAALYGGAALSSGRTYWFFEARSETIDPADPLAQIDPNAWPKRLAELFASTEELLVHDVRTLKPLQSWTRGRVALLGDAAHAMAPNLGQGAAQAIEDAAALQAALTAATDLAQALQTYEATRIKRATLLQNESARAAKLALSARTGPRDLAVKLVPEAVRARMIGRLVG